MKINLFVILLISLFTALPAQESDGYIELIKKERELSGLFDQLLDPEVIGNKAPLFERIDSLFLSALAIDESFDYPWNKLENAGKLTSEDKKMRIYSWAWMASPEEYRYAAYIQVRKKRGDFSVYRLKQGDDEKIRSEEYQQQFDDWHGKIYYDLVTTRHRRNRYYTLIGADFNNSYTNIKTIEVLNLRRDRPEFMKEVFLDAGTVRDRIVFEYSSEVAMTLRYDDNLGKIVFDHLAPLHPIYHEVYQFYGPDGSYDAYEFREGIWVKQEDVDARNMR